ncbi:hypothetical protein [Halanaeroarchaeum sulfurireducens]|uniref:hypothetical protein n=1 Tax=Halanaeroarchaeum sulfurireducens TaxID=1604004 RepID=UPI0009AD672E|nr:hypothetical protein [Halanaeroarchaeum sulfurireducens]
MKSRIVRGLSRAKYAAVFADVGAGIGGLFGRSTASSGAAAGALIGASLGEQRFSGDSISERVKGEVNERVAQVSM